MGIVGLDVNRPIDVDTGHVRPTVDPNLAGNVSYVRVNFIHGPEAWESPAHPEWQATYDRIVDGYLDRGIEIYGLIGHEVMHEHPETRFQTHRLGDAGSAWIDTYADHFATIVEYFHGRVHVWESFNEPNNWHAGQPLVSPFWFAKMLAEIYRVVKIERDVPDVTLVSGPLLAHNNYAPFDRASMAYFEETFKRGKQDHGWEQIRRVTGSYPLDGVGFHLYVDQGADKSATTIAATIRRYLDELYDVWRREDAAAAHKKIYVSEFGWQSSIVGEEKQAQNMRAAFDVFREDPRVALAVWFGTQDFRLGDRVESWGLFPTDGLDEGHRKPAYVVLQVIAESDRTEQEAAPQTAGRFQSPVGAPDRDRFERFKLVTRFVDPAYFARYGVWHPGEDWSLKRGGAAEAREPVNAVANGRVLTAESFPGWGNIVLIEHRLPNGDRVWSQYAHVSSYEVTTGQFVERGRQIGTIEVDEQNPHAARLHFEIRLRALPANQWRPIVADRNEVFAHYANPSAFIKEHRSSDPYRRHEIVLDSERTDQRLGTFVRATADNWFRAPVGFRGSTLWTYASPDRETNWGEWRPNLRQRGRYEVSVFVPRNHATTRNARYTVFHADGDTAVTINQLQVYDAWVSLGTYNFQAGSGGAVRLTDVTGEAPPPGAPTPRVAFDAVKWVLMVDDEA